MAKYKRTLAQAGRFLAVSGVSFLIDAGAYFALTAQIGLESSLAKRISFACIALWAFFAHKFFTFRHRELRASEPVKFALLYFSGWLLNSAVHDANMESEEASRLAFLLATFAWACYNFIGQKLFVFRELPISRLGRSKRRDL